MLGRAADVAASRAAREAGTLVVDAADAGAAMSASAIFYL